MEQKQCFGKNCKKVALTGILGLAMAGTAGATAYGLNNSKNGVDIPNPYSVVKFNELTDKGQIGPMQYVCIKGVNAISPGTKRFSIFDGDNVTKATTIEDISMNMPISGPMITCGPTYRNLDNTIGLSGEQFYSTNEYGEPTLEYSSNTKRNSEFGRGLSDAVYAFVGPLRNVGNPVESTRKFINRKLN